MVSTIILTIVVIFFAICLFTIVWTCFSFVAWLPSLKKDLKRISKLVDLKPGEVFYELGAGNGRVAFYIAKKYYNNKVIAIELAFPLFIIGKIKQLFSSNKNISFYWKNLFKQNLSKADVIYVFGIPNKNNKKLLNKLKKELKPGAKLISYVFKFKELEPIFVDQPTKQDKAIYVYKF